MNSSELTKGIGIVFGLFFKGGAGFSIRGFAGTPQAGTSGTFAGTKGAAPGSLVVDTTGKKLYINTNTQASPTWTVVGSQT